MGKWYSNPVFYAFLATLGTWFVTALGASLVLFTRRFSQKWLDASLGMAAGVMIAASFWSLLQPAIEMSRGWYERSGLVWLPATAGFLLGAGVLRIIDLLLPHLHPSLAVAEGPKSSWQRSTLLVLAITIHNIPEGLAVGVAFGAAAGLAGNTQEYWRQINSAIALAIGIGLQNFPEGTVVALPLRREGMSRFRSFWYGQLSAVVEPVAAVAGAMLVAHVAAILPYALAFAAGAMIYVVAEELIPESQRKGNVDLATMGVIVGFCIMMALDVGLG
jgi:ZIP family zinc transporter